MFKRLTLLSLLALTLIAAVNAQPVTQEGTLVIKTNTYTNNFGKQLTFELVATADIEITNAALLIEVSGTGRTDVAQAKVITPGKEFKVQVTRDLQAQPIAPFTIVSYSWRLTSNQNQVRTSPHKTFIYEDNRFNWQSTKRDPIVAHWYNGDLAFGQYIADIGYRALENAGRLIGAKRPANVDIYVYATLADLQSSMQLGGRTWVGGHADPKIGLIMVTAAPDSLSRLNLERDVPHELGHILIYQTVPNGYDLMPVWLDEGLAVNAELQPRADFAVALNDAVKRDRLLPLSSLCGPFSADPNAAILSYAESASFVRYLLDQYGSAKLKELLTAYNDSATCEGGIQRVYNRSLTELQAEWQTEVLNTNPVGRALRDLSIVCLPFMAVAIILALLIFIPKRPPAA